MRAVKSSAVLNLPAVSTAPGLVVAQGQQEYGHWPDMGRSLGGAVLERGDIPRRACLLLALLSQGSWVAVHL